MTEAAKELTMFDEQYQPLLSDGFESIGIFKDYIQADRYVGICDIGLPLQLAFNGTVLKATIMRTIDMKGYIADPANYSYTDGIKKFIGKLNDTWKRFGPNLEKETLDTVYKWTKDKCTLEELTEVTLQLQTVWNKESQYRQPVIQNKLWMWTFGGLDKVTKRIELNNVDGYFTLPSSERVNRLTVVSSTRQAIVPWAEFLFAYDQNDLLPLIFDLCQHAYVTYTHRTGEQDVVLALVKVFTSKLTESIQMNADIDIDAWLYYNCNNVAAFNLTQTMLDNDQPAVNRELLFLERDFLLTLRVEDYMTDQAVIKRRVDNVALGHYPNAFDSGSRSMFLLPIGKDHEYVQMTRFEDTYDPITTSLSDSKPLAGYNDDCTPFEVQDAEFNKSIGIVRELQKDFRILRLKTINPYNVVIQSPVNKYGVPSKFWQLLFFLHKANYVFPQLTGDLASWYSNIHSIYTGNLFKLSDDQFDVSDFTAVKSDAEKRALAATVFSRSNNFYIPNITTINNRDQVDKLPAELKQIGEMLFPTKTSQ